MGWKTLEETDDLQKGFLKRWENIPPSGKSLGCVLCSHGNAQPILWKSACVLCIFSASILLGFKSALKINFALAKVHSCERDSLEVLCCCCILLFRSSWSIRCCSIKSWGILAGAQTSWNKRTCLILPRVIKCWGSGFPFRVAQADLHGCSSFTPSLVAIACRTKPGCQRNGSYAQRSHRLILWSLSALSLMILEPVSHGSPKLKLCLGGKAGK